MKAIRRCRQCFADMEPLPCFLPPASLLQQRNYPQFPLIFFAALSMGFICVPYNAWLLSHELEYCVKDSGCSLLFVDPEREDRLTPVIDNLRKSGLQKVIFCRSGTDEDKSKKRKWADADWEEVLGELAGKTVSMPVEKVDPEDDCTIFYTSGSELSDGFGVHFALFSKALLLFAL